MIRIMDVSFIQNQTEICINSAPFMRVVGSRRQTRISNPQRQNTQPAKGKTTKMDKTMLRKKKGKKINDRTEDATV